LAAFPDAAAARKKKQLVKWRLPAVMDISVQLLESSVAWRNSWEEKEGSPQGNKGINSFQENSHSSWRMRFCIAILDFTTLQELKKSWRHITETGVDISTGPQHWAKAEHEENSRWLGGKLEEEELRRTNERKNERTNVFELSFKHYVQNTKFTKSKGLVLLPRKDHTVFVCLFVCVVIRCVRHTFCSPDWKANPHAASQHTHTKSNLERQQTTGENMRTRRKDEEEEEKREIQVKKPKLQRHWEAQQRGGGPAQELRSSQQQQQQ
jgi:hypothetical protein